MDSINAFGHLTLSNGTRIEFKDLDLDGNGEITEEEVKKVLEDNKTDTVELTTANKQDNVITEEDFVVCQQKAEINEAINNKITTDKDLTGVNSSLIPAVKDEMNSYAETFIKEYQGDTSKLADAFKEAMEEKYETVKQDFLQNSSVKVKSRVLDSAYDILLSEFKADSNISEELAKSITNTLVKKLEVIANNFIKAYKGENLETDLLTRLLTVVNEPEASRMKDSIEDYRALYSSLGSYKDENDFAALKEAAKDLLQKAVDSGITVKLGNTNIATEAAITAALKTYTDAEQLNSDIEAALSSLSEMTLKEAAIAAKTTEAAEQGNKTSTGANGESYAINVDLIDLSKIRGYGDEISEKSWGWSRNSSADKAMNKGAAMLESRGLKSQVKAQFESVLKEKGVPFKEFETIFENVYSKTRTEALEEVLVTDSNNKKGLSLRNYASIDTAKLVSTFLEKFNTNITEAINEVNASDKDLDLQDIDYSVLNRVYISGSRAEDLYFTGKDTKSSLFGSRNLKNKSKMLVETLRPQIYAKAKSMCEANGVTFDSTVFETMFNNARLTSADAAVEGKLRATLNTQTLIDTFNQSFKETYTNWVETEKNKSAIK